MFPVGLGILWLVELLLNVLVEWGLGWRPSGLLFYLAFVGGGLVLIVAMILAAKLATITTAFLAPRFRTGLLLLGAVYVAAQIVCLYPLLTESESAWQYVLMKIEFAIVVSIVLIIAYRAEDSHREGDPQPAEDTAS